MQHAWQPPRPAGPLCQSLGPVSDSLANLCAPHHRMLSVSELEGERGSALTCSGKWRRGGLSVGLSVGLGTTRAVHWHLYPLSAQCLLESEPHGMASSSSKWTKPEGKLMWMVERRLVTGGALSQGNDAFRNDPAPLSPLPETRWYPDIPNHANNLSRCKLDSIHQHASGQASGSPC